MMVRSVTALFLVTCFCWCILVTEARPDEDPLARGVAKKPARGKPPAGGKPPATRKPTTIPLRAKQSTKAAPRIVGGIRVNPPYKYPSIVSVKIGGTPSCGGTILNKDWVMSAAHCTEQNPQPEDYVFTAGEYRLKGKSGFEQVTTAVEMIVHEKYNPTTIENDIVLFKVIPPFKFSDKIKPAILPNKDFIPGPFQFAVGWGLTSDGGDASDYLMEVSLEIISDDECIKRYKKQNSLVTNTMMCSLNPQGGKDACQGGPFYHMNETHQIVTGIVSWGIGCAQAGNPGVYTEVSHFLDWINTKLDKGKRKVTKKPPKKTKGQKKGGR